MAKMTAEEVADRLKGIPDFILSKIAVIIESYQKEASVAEGSAVEQCPKCGSLHPRIIKGGKTSTGKQMFRCLECQRRFTADYGTYSFYSHQSSEAWNELIKSTLAGDSLKSISFVLGVNVATAFRMRH